MPGPEIPRLTPAPLHLLVAMARGAVLHECVKDRRFVIERRCRGFERIHTRGVNTLRSRALIERSSDPLEWRITEAGKTWLVAKGIMADLDKLR